MDHELQIAWAAGFFDGEGTVTIQRRKGREGKAGAYVMQIAAFQKHPEPLYRLQQIFACGSLHAHVRRTSGSSSSWAWRTSGRFAMVVLQRMLPYLVVKKDQSEIAIAFQARRIQSIADRKNKEIVGAQNRSDEIDRVRIRAMKHAPFSMAYPLYTQQ